MSLRDELLSDYRSLPTAEERLEWLCERVPLRPQLADAETSDVLRIRECVSPLWFLPQYEDGVCLFAARATSRVVGGVATFLCDYYSGMTPDEILAEGGSIVGTLRLEQLLGMTRRMTVERIVERVCEFAGHAATDSSATKDRGAQK